MEVLPVSKLTHEISESTLEERKEKCCPDTVENKREINGYT